MKAVLLHGYGGVDQLHYERMRRTLSPARAKCWCG